MLLSGLRGQFEEEVIAEGPGECEVHDPFTINCTINGKSIDVDKYIEEAVVFNITLEPTAKFVKVCYNCGEYTWYARAKGHVKFSRSCRTYDTEANKCLNYDYEIVVK